MLTIPQVSQAIQHILTDRATQLAQETGLIQRQRKVTGANFSQTLVWGWLSNPAATLEELCQTGAAVGLAITPQGLEQRFTPQAAHFLQRLLAATVTTLLATDPVAMPLLQRFNGVYLTDSSFVQLPDVLKTVWQGFGGRVATSAAAVKLQVRLNMLTGQLAGPILCDARCHDRAAARHHPALPPGSLHLADLGYWKLAALAALSARKCGWLSRLQVQTKLIDAAGRVWSQEALIGAQTGDAFDLPVCLGVKQQLPARLLGRRVPPQRAAQRRRRLKEEARSRGQTVSQARLDLADWDLLVTNLPVSQLSWAEAFVLARLRWQIELLFKLWKQDGQIATSRSDQPWRILCELYAKLIAMVIQHWVFLLGHWAAYDRSWTKGAKTVRQHALSLAVALRSRRWLHQVLRTVNNCLRQGCRINKSRKTPRTYQLLLAATESAMP